VTDSTINTLKTAIIDADKFTVTLSEQLSRTEYEAVNEVLSRLNGKWNKKANAHIFPYDPTSLIAAVIESRELPPKNPTAFFPTPAKIVDLMLDAINICDWDNQRILEPSAGTGAIATAAKLRAPSAIIDCCEILDVNRNVLKAKGLSVVSNDFLSYTPDCLYDAILMNPPFSVEGDKLAYATHIIRAWDLLNYHGQIAAIVPRGWLSSENSKRIREFSEFVNEWMEFSPIHAGAFSESGTEVATMLIYGQKERQPWRRCEYNGWNSYHSWNACLWMENDYETYMRARKADNIDDFKTICADAVKTLRNKEYVAINLNDDDINELFEYFQSE